MEARGLPSMGLDVDGPGIGISVKDCAAPSAHTPERPSALRTHRTRSRRNRPSSTSCASHSLWAPRVLILPPFRPRGSSRFLFQPNPNFANSEGHAQYFSPPSR